VDKSTTDWSFGKHTTEGTTRVTCMRHTAADLRPRSRNCKILSAEKWDSSAYSIDRFASLISLVKKKSKLMINLCSLCTLSTFECLNQSLWNLARISRQLSTPQIQPISICVCVWIPHIVARQRHGKNVTEATRNRKKCWRRRFLCGPCRYKGKQTISFS
jgi:hypothetical protein